MMPNENPQVLTDVPGMHEQVSIAQAPARTLYTLTLPERSFVLEGPSGHSAAALTAAYDAVVAPDGSPGFLPWLLEQGWTFVPGVTELNPDMTGVARQAAAYTTSNGRRFTCPQHPTAGVGRVAGGREVQCALCGHTVLVLAEDDDWPASELTKVVGA